MTEIEAFEFVPVENRGALKAFCNLKLGHVVINDCRIIQEPYKRPWVAMPQISYKNQYGTVKYRSLVQITDENLRIQITHIVLTEWEKFNKGGNRNGRK